MKKILVSSCFLGTNCKYNGGNNKNEKILSVVKGIKCTSICPEVLGGLCTPREPAEIVGGDGITVLKGNAKVINSKGQDVTGQFVDGAYRTLQIAQEGDFKQAILKANSPSCGNENIYNGKFNGGKVKGMGVTAALLTLNGITVYSEKENLHGLFKGD